MAEREGRKGQAQIRDGEHGKEVVHGLMEAPLCLNKEEEGKISQERKKDTQRERDNYSDVTVLPYGGATKEEFKSFDLSIIERRHDVLKGR